jgi:hypothetical protein
LTKLDDLRYSLKSQRECLLLLCYRHLVGWPGQGPAPML